MIKKLRSLWRVTAIRLSLIYTLVFGLASVGIILYMTGATVSVVRQQYETSIEQEVEGLARLYRRGGVNLLFRALERRANAPGANLYVVSNPQGRIIAGNVPEISPRIMRQNGWVKKPFEYERYDENEDSNRPSKSRAIASIVEVPNGMKILVGRDIREYEVVGKIVGDAFKIALAFMLGLGLLTWLLVGRRALKRIDGVTQSSKRILSGDRNERLPITGSNDEFDRLSNNLNLMLDRIDNLDEGLKEISDNIAHDLKTPITRLRNKAVDALSIEKKSEDKQVALEEIISDCDQIVKTFDALMMISRVDSGSTVAKLKPTDLVEITSDMHELYEAICEDENILLSKRFNTTIPIIVSGNRELLSQAVSNLIDNAMKYGQPSENDHKITLELSQDGGNAILQVSDNGPGIPDQEINRVKDRFVRLDQSRNKPGNGLGLSLVQAIADFHGGSLIISNNNPGLCVSLAIPISVKNSE